MVRGGGDDRMVERALIVSPSSSQRASTSLLSATSGFQRHTCGKLDNQLHLQDEIRQTRLARQASDRMFDFPSEASDTYF